MGLQAEGSNLVGDDVGLAGPVIADHEGHDGSERVLQALVVTMTQPSVSPTAR
jgi:hypothetical protein